MYKGQVLDESFIHKLYKQVKKLDKRGVKWLMTQADTKQIKNIFKEYVPEKSGIYSIILLRCLDLLPCHLINVFII